MNDTALKKRIEDSLPPISNLTVHPSSGNEKFRLSFDCLDRRFDLSAAVTGNRCCILLRTDTAKENEILVNRFNAAEARMTCYSDDGSLFFRRIEGYVNEEEEIVSKVIEMLTHLIVDDRFIFLRLMKGAC